MEYFNWAVNETKGLTDDFIKQVGATADEVFERELKPFMQLYGKEVTKDGQKISTAQALKLFEKEKLTLEKMTSIAC